jgi:hypothetical protein
VEAVSIGVRGGQGVGRPLAIACMGLSAWWVKARVWFALNRSNVCPTESMGTAGGGPRILLVSRRWSA